MTSISPWLRASIIPCPTKERCAHSNLATREGGEPSQTSGSPKKRARSNPYVLWSDLLRRVFEQDALQCPGCGGRRSIIAFLQSPPDWPHRGAQDPQAPGSRRSTPSTADRRAARALLTEGQGALFGLCLAALPSRPLRALAMDSKRGTHAPCKGLVKALTRAKAHQGAGKRALDFLP